MPRFWTRSEVFLVCFTFQKIIIENDVTSISDIDDDLNDVVAVVNVVVVVAADVVAVVEMKTQRAKWGFIILPPSCVRECTKTSKEIEKWPELWFSSDVFSWDLKSDQSDVLACAEANEFSFYESSV